MRSRLQFLLLLMFFQQLQSFGQEIQIDSNSHERPKIGLILSGGAAHGFAHIGVIKRLEELNIPIDYITGTSMGAVIGGMYAMGYSSEEIYQIAETQDWSLILNNSVPLEEISIVEKRQHTKNPFYIVWNGQEFDLPRGVLGGQKMDLILSRLYAPAHFVNDFNDLPIPFKCVAVDIVTGDIVQFTSGYLGKSIRASMAIPSVFPAVEVDGRLFVDGGLRRNFPVIENIEMGSDILIGSYVGSRRKSKEELNSLVDILSQSTSLSGILDAESNAKMVDVLLKPECEDFSYFDFDAFDQFTDLGYKATLEKDDELLAIKEQLSDFPTQPKPEKIITPKKIKITKIVLHSNNSVMQQLILGKLGFDEGDEVTLSEIEEGASEVYGMNYFSKVSYNFFTYEDGVGLELITEENELLKLGLSYNRFEHFGSSLIVNGEFRNLLFKPSRIYLSTRISSKPGIDLVYQYRFWRNPNWVLQLEALGENNDLPFYRNRVVDRLYNQFSSDLSVSFLKEIDKTFLFALTYNFHSNYIKPEVGKPNDINSLDINVQSVKLQFDHNTLNKKSFTTSGIKLNAELVYNFETKQILSKSPESDFLNDLETKVNLGISVQGKYFQPLFEKVSWNVQSSASLFSRDNIFPNFKLGGTAQLKNRFLSFIGADDSEFLIGSHVCASTGVQFQIFDQIYFSPKAAFVFANNLLENAYSDIGYLTLFGAGIEFGVSTPIGPILLDVGYSFRNKGVASNIGIGHRHVF